MTIEVTDITIKMGQKKVSLTPDQARELMEALQTLLGEDASPKVIERIIERQPWRWWYPKWSYPYDTTTAGKWGAGGNISNSESGSVTLSLASA